MSQKGVDPANQVDRTLRLRENKRRNRQRQKDYTAELESRLRNLQSEGVKATQEVQLSARRVVQDNLRLKALLRSKGVDEHTINTWTPDGEIANSPTAKGQGASTTETNHYLLTPESSPLPCDKSQAPESECSYTSPSIEPNAEVIPRSSENVENAPLNESSLRLAPCKLMSRLAENPSTDLTQIELSDHHVEEDEAEGVECSKAYKMLIQFVTSEEKLDTISRALESGCTKGSKGGCKVRNEVIWKAMDAVS